MRFRALIALALLAACSKADAPGTDTAAMAGDALASGMAGMWDVRVMPEGRDTVLATYVLNTTDSSNWTLTFPNREPIPMRETGRGGDTVMTEAGPFESAVRAGQMVSVSTKTWIENGMLRGKTTARYQNAGADSVAMLRQEGTRRQ